MKKIFTLLAFLSAGTGAMAQVGAVAPDFTVTDINGNSHNLYSYLDAGKVVLLDVSATWCGPCWNFHNAHYLEDLYAEYGPSGTDEVVVLFYEGDAATNSNDLNGTGTNTQGDWVTGTPYPIINEAPLQLNLNTYAPLGFPTINVISCNDKKIKWDLWDSQVSGNTAQSLQNMRTKVQEQIDACTTSAGVEELALLEVSVAPNPASDFTQIAFQSNVATTATVELYSVSGQLISTSVSEVVNGTNEINVELSALEIGTYFVKVTTTEMTSTMIPVVKK